ncbi:MAG: CapA family protein [Candidatus Lernaella stagnicola]|nr:CapA family protein [Candidatus Lernaella stagnicola]
MRRAGVLVIGCLLLGLLVAACGETPVELPEPKRVTLAPQNENELHLVFGGDTMIDDLALPWLLAHGWDYTLRGLKPLFERADLVGLNLEVPVARACRRSKTKKYSYVMMPEALAGLKNNGVDVVNLANNHYRDCGPAGKESTVRFLDEWGIEHIGGGLTPAEAGRPLIVQFGETTVGLLGFYGYSGNHAKHGTAQLTEASVRGLIGGLRPLVDVLVVNVHWGKNYVVDVDAKQRRFGHLMLDLGADAIVGHGPHIPQAMELYSGKPLVYSVGNGAFATGNNRAHESLLAEFIVRDRRIRNVVFHPIWNQNRHEGVRWQPRPAKGKRAARTLRRFAAASAQFGAALTIRDDTAELPLR